MRSSFFVTGGIACLVFLTADTTSAQTAPEVIQVDTAAPGRPFPHFWEQMFGSGRANLTLRESWRHDLRAARAVTDFRYVRFHDIFHDHNGVYSEAKDGTPIYNWSYVDQIYDGLLADRRAAVRRAELHADRPWPPRRSRTRSGTSRCRTHPSRTRSGATWSAPSRGTLRIATVRMRSAQWYFEVWNEPNIDFWSGKPASRRYFELYESAARAVKAVDKRLRVGGPATAQAAWVGDFHPALHPEGRPARFRHDARLRQRQLAGTSSAATKRSPRPKWWPARCGRSTTRSRRRRDRICRSSGPSTTPPT